MMRGVIMFGKMSRGQMFKEYVCTDSLEAAIETAKESARRGTHYAFDPMVMAVAKVDSYYVVYNLHAMSKRFDAIKALPIVYKTQS